MFVFFLNPIFSQVPLSQFGSDVFVSNSPNTEVQSAISEDGLTQIIGSSLYPNGSGLGMARIFKYTSGNWVQLGSDILGEVEGEEFGSEVAISDDGLTVAIGAWKKTTASLGWGTGYVKVYTLVSGNWVQKGLSLFGTNVNGVFGKKICLSNDGNTIAVGSYNTNPQYGKINVFNFASGNWLQYGSNTINNGIIENSIYSATIKLDISANGNRLVTITASGGISIFDLISNQWTRTNNPINLYNFGLDSLSISGDGNTIILGGDFSFFIYKDIGSSNWQYSYGENFSPIGNGVYVSTSYNGNVVVAYDYWNSTVRLYQFSGNSWNYFANIQPFQGFYGGIDLSADGTKVSTLSRTSTSNPYNHNRTLKVYNVSPFLSNQSNEIANFSVYPNPAKSEITIKLQEGFTLEKINLYNPMGQKIFESNNNILDIRSYSKGCYLLEVITDKTTTVKRVIFD